MAKVFVFVSCWIINGLGGLSWLGYNWSRSPLDGSRVGSNWPRSPWDGLYVALVPLGLIQAGDISDLMALYWVVVGL